jgi:hypothetical protein
MGEGRAASDIIAFSNGIKYNHNERNIRHLLGLTNKTDRVIQCGRSPWGD